MTQRESINFKKNKKKFSPSAYIALCIHIIGKNNKKRKWKSFFFVRFFKENCDIELGTNTKKKICVKYVL